MRVNPIDRYVYISMCCTGHTVSGVDACGASADALYRYKNLVGYLCIHSYVDRVEFNYTYMCIYIVIYYVYIYRERYIATDTDRKAFIDIHAYRHVTYWPRRPKIWVNTSIDRYIYLPATQSPG